MLRNDVFSLPCVERKNRGGTTKNPRCEEKTHTMRLPQLPFLGRGGRQNIKGGGRQPGRQGGGEEEGEKESQIYTRHKDQTTMSEAIHSVGRFYVCHLSSPLFEGGDDGRGEGDDFSFGATAKWRDTSDAVIPKSHCFQGKK